MYTSGTTGNPKGAIYKHSNVLSMITANVMHNSPKLIGSRHLSYLPLAHIAERGICLISIFFGGKIGVFNGNKFKLKEDIEVLKP